MNFNQNLKIVQLLIFVIFITENACDHYQQEFQQSLDQIKKNLEHDIYSHPGTTFENVECTQYETKKRVVALDRPQTTNLNLIENYFKSRCDFRIVYIDQALAKSETPGRIHKYVAQYYFLNPNYALTWMHTNFEEAQQIHNHIPGIVAHLSEQHSMVKNLQKYDRRGLFKFNSSEFHPQSYVFEIEKSNFSEEENKFINNKDDVGFWVKQDPKGYGGNGMKLYRGTKDLKQEIVNVKSTHEKIQKNPDWLEINRSYSLIQKYLEKPLLINGYKPQQRRLILIASVKPFVILAQAATSMICSKQFDLDFKEFDASQAPKHINNQNIQTRNPGYQDVVRDFLWAPPRLYEYLEQEMGFSKEKINQYNHKVNRAIVYAILASKDNLDLKTGFFQLLSADFLFDENLTPWLLEFNTASAYPSFKNHQKYIYPQFIQTTYDLILKSHEKPDQLWKFWKNPDVNNYLGRFQMLYNEATGYSILKQYQNHQQEDL